MCFTLLQQDWIELNWDPGRESNLLVHCLHTAHNCPVIPSKWNSSHAWVVKHETHSFFVRASNFTSWTRFIFYLRKYQIKFLTWKVRNTHYALHTNFKDVFETVSRSFLSIIIHLWVCLPILNIQNLKPPFKNTLISLSLKNKLLNKYSGI